MSQKGVKTRRIREMVDSIVSSKGVLVGGGLGCNGLGFINMTLHFSTNAYHFLGLVRNSRLKEGWL